MSESGKISVLKTEIAGSNPAPGAYGTGPGHSVVQY